jgi:hypothetical protein
MILTSSKCGKVLEESLGELHCTLVVANRVSLLTTLLQRGIIFLAKGEVLPMLRSESEVQRIHLFLPDFWGLCPQIDLQINFQLPHFAIIHNKYLWLVACR